jgi:hypothetical protein
MPVEPLDLVEIQNLIADYVFCIDSRDLVSFRELWTEDAVFRLARDAVRLGAPLHGRDGIVDGFAAFFAREDRGSEEFIRHFCTNSRFSVVDEEVRAETGLFSVRHFEGGVRPSRSGVYRDRIVREAGRWRFAERELAWDPPER